MSPFYVALWQENLDSEYNGITKSYKCKSSFTQGVNNVTLYLLYVYMSKDFPVQTLEQGKPWLECM